MKIIIVGGGQIGSYITSYLKITMRSVLLKIELKHLKTIKMPDYQKNV